VSDNLTLVSVLASGLNKTAKKVVKQKQLVEAISEVTLETQIAGASTLTITLADPDWVLQTSGLWEAKKEILTPVEVNFPEGSEMFWRLCMVDGTTDLNGPNLTLTFEDVIVAELRGHHGPLSAPPGTLSRPEFVRKLVNQVSAGIRFVCPALKKGLPTFCDKPIGKTVAGTRKILEFAKANNGSTR